MVDSDGSINISKIKPYGRQRNPAYTLALSVETTSEECCRQFYDCLNCGTISKRQRKKKKTSYRWCVFADQAVNALEKLLPYLVQKKDQAVAAVEFQKHKKQSNSEKREQQYKNLKSLKTKNRKLTLDKQCEFSWEWLAGMFDGDGSVGLYISCGKYSIQATVLCDHLAVANHINIRCVKGSVKEVISKNKVKMYKFLCCGKESVQELLRGIFEFSIVKKPQIEVGLQYCGRPGKTGDNISLSQTEIQERIRIAEQLRSLKNTGDWVESCSALIEYADGELELLLNLHEAYSE